jgi:hypothetical protein
LFAVMFSLKYRWLVAVNVIVTVLALPGANV